MAPHSSTPAWKIPWTEEPGRLQSMGSLSWTRLRNFTFTFHFHALEKEMAAHSSVLAWRIPGTGEPGGLPSMGSNRVGHDWSDLAAAAADWDPRICISNKFPGNASPGDLVLFSHSVVSLFATLWTAARQASLSFTISVCLNSHSLSQWCHPTISSCHPLILLPAPSFPASGSFPMSQFFQSGGRHIGASASVLPVNSQSWFPLGLTGLIFLLSKELSRVFSSTTVQKHQLFGAQPSSQSNSHIHTWPQEKP